MVICLLVWLPWQQKTPTLIMGKRLNCIFSLPGRSPRRAFALPLVSASTFTLKFFKRLYFPDRLIDLVHIWYDHIVPKFYSAIPQPITSRSRSRTWKFLMLKFFKRSYFPNYMMDFVHIWYGDRYSSKVLFSSTLPMLMTSRSRSQT